MFDRCKAVADTLRGFIKATTRPVLVVGCADRDVILLAKLLQAIDREPRPAVVLSFAEPCPSPAAYVDAIVGRLRLQVEAVAARRAAEQPRLEPWPPLPDAAADPRRTPTMRLRALLDWSAVIVPDDHALVWALLPAEIADLDAWLGFVAPLLPLPAVDPELARHRLIVRDAIEPGRLIPLLRERGCPHARVMTVDMSPERMLDDLVGRAKHPALPLDQRLDALVVLAATDLAHARLDEARRKYELLFAHADARNDVGGKLRGLLGLGEAATRANQHELALRRYQQGLELASADGALEQPRLPIVLELLRGASSASERLEHLDDAEHYCKAAEHVAALTLNFGALCDASGQRAKLLHRRGQDDAARELWARARALAEQFDDHERARELAAAESGARS